MRSVLPVVLERPRIEALLAGLERGPDVRVTVDLEHQTLTGPGGMRAGFAVPPFEKTMLALGVDEIGLTLRDAPRLDAFEAGYRDRMPWIG